VFSWAEFAAAVTEVCNVTIDAQVAGDLAREDPNQKQIVAAPAAESLFVTAGPGSGKTTSATLRILKLVYIDGLPPESIFATTFTRRAAAVLRSRITSWGEELRAALGQSNPGALGWLELLDLNRIRVGTLDSLAQDVLNENKRAGDPRPTPVEPHILTSLMLTEAVFSTPASTRSSQSAAVAAYLRQFYDSEWATDPGRAKALIEFRQRLINDQIDRAQLRASANSGSPEDLGLHTCLDCIEQFESVLKSREIYDFSSVNEAFLQSLADGRLEGFLSELRFVLVDEYQDTNYLQESIYSRLAKAAADNGGSIMVVGDDDQSLYRFRGATVELFSAFESRLRQRTGITATPRWLDRNYRSTEQIVKLVNDYVGLDANYAPARVAGKPVLQHGKANNNSFPILGLFRSTEDQVAQSLARLISKLQSGRTIVIPTPNGNIELALNAEEGSAGDIAVLTYSAAELSSRPRFPRKLRDALENQSPPVRVFNPRGCPLRTIEPVQELLGNVLECLDGNGAVLAELQSSADGRLRYIDNAACLQQWRNMALSKRASRSPDLARFVDAWSRRKPTRRVTSARVSLNDIIFKLIKWIPDFQSDIEHLAWLEAIQRSVAAAAVLQGFSGEILFDATNPTSDLSRASVRQAYRRVFFPIAENVVEVAEDTLETLPLDRVSIMTIHQSKGLEFPITVVDIGTALENLTWMPARSRYPSRPDTSHKMEDALRPYSGINLSIRSSIDRAFDDLVRNYFVAFSRAQDVLILVGHEHARSDKARGKPAQHVGSGWVRPASGLLNGAWPWRGKPFLVSIEDAHL
jgi:DNA helicase II / ATP-dependent DNA helicase PcrA